MNCPNCHSEIHNDSVFCEYCGEKIITDNAPVVVDSSSTTPSIHSDSPTTISNPTPTQSSPVSPPPVVVSSSNADQNTGKKPIKTTIAATIAVLLILCLSVLSAFLYTRFQSALQQIDALETSVSEKDKTIASQKSEINELEADLKKVRSDLVDYIFETHFYETYAVIVPDNGQRKYHVYNCEDLADHDFWIYNVDAAEQKGYYACPKCH